MVLNLQRKSWSALSRKVSAGKPCGALKHGWVLRCSKRGLNGSGHSQVKGVRDSGERLSGEGLHGEGLGDNCSAFSEGGIFAEASNPACVIDEPICPACGTKLYLEPNRVAGCLSCGRGWIVKTQ